MRDLPEHERPFLTRFGMVLDAYKEAAAQARYYRENKKAVFSRMVMEVLTQEGEMPTNKAELKVRASKPWQDYLDRLIETANRSSDLKMQVDNLACTPSSSWSEPALRRGYRAVEIAMGCPFRTGVLWGARVHS